MTRDLLKVAWAERATYAALLAALTTAALVIGVLAALATSLSASSQGDPASLAVIATVALISTAIIIDAITRHSIAERWPTLRRLRMVGLGGWALRGYLALESVVVGFVASVLGFAAALAIAPALVPYLASLAVVPAEVEVRGSLLAYGLVLAGIVVVALVGTAGAARASAKREPIEPLVADAGQRRSTVRVVGTVVISVSALAALAGAGTATTPESGFLLGLLATAAAMAALGASWRYLSAAAVRMAIALRGSRMSAPALVSSRWTASAARTTTSSAAMLALGLTVFFGGYPVITDAAARDRLDVVLSGAKIWTNDGDATPPRTNGTVTLTQVDVELAGAGAAEPAQVLTVADAKNLLRRTTLSGSVTPGLVMTAERASTLDAYVGDRFPVALPAQNDIVELRLVVITATPGTWGDFFITDTRVRTPSGPATVVAWEDVQLGEGWTGQPASQWIQSLPAGAAVSATGGQGQDEIGLLIGAPLALFTALAVSSTIISTHARRNEINKLGRVGMARSALLNALTRQALATTLPALAIAFIASVALVLAATRPYLRSLDIGYSGVGPVSQYAWVAATLIGTTIIATLGSARPAVFQRR